jgi:hypothetical protein
MTMEQPLYYREESPESGAVFALDAIRFERDSFRVHLIVTNTGEHGTLRLRFEINSAYIMGEAKAAQWLQDYPLLYAQGRIGQDMVALSDEAVMLIPTAGTILPASIDRGQTWDGWFETVRRPLMPGATAMLMSFGPFLQQTPPRGLVHRLFSETVPFVSLKEPVTVQPLAGADLLSIRGKAVTSSYLQELLQLDTLIAIPGAVAGAIIGAQTGAAGALIGGVGGALVGGMVGRLLRWYVGAHRRT